MADEDLIADRLGRSFEALGDAKLLFANGSYRAVANRLYYAAFYAATALLASIDLDAKTHRGVKNIFYKEFIATNIFNNVLSETYQNLIELRSDSDYEDFVIVKRSDVEDLLVPTDEFLTAVRKHLSK